MQIIALIVGKIIADIFGKYTLLLYFTLTNNKEGKAWLKKPENTQEDEFGGSFLINVVGLLSFTITFIGFFKLLDLIDWLRFEYF